MLDRVKRPLDAVGEPIAGRCESIRLSDYGGMRETTGCNQPSANDAVAATLSELDRLQKLLPKRIFVPGTGS